MTLLFPRLHWHLPALREHALALAVVVLGLALVAGSFKVVDAAVASVPWQVKAQDGAAERSLPDEATLRAVAAFEHSLPEVPSASADAISL